MRTNKVYLNGVVVCRPKIVFDNSLNCKIVHFVLAVPRDDDTRYLKGYNMDEYNYFYCLLSEKLFSVQKLYEACQKFKRLDRVEIEGTLDNRINEKTRDMYTSQQIKFRALNSFVSIVCVEKIRDYVPVDKLGRKKKPSIADRMFEAHIRETYGNNAQFKLVDGAEKKNYYGFEKEDDLPDY